MGFFTTSFEIHTNILTQCVFLKIVICLLLELLEVFSPTTCFSAFRTYQSISKAILF